MYFISIIYKRKIQEASYLQSIILTTGGSASGDNYHLQKIAEK
jgi:hypothetical protein